MAHFARVVEGTVVKVHVLANDVIIDAEGVEQEQLGQEFLAGLHGGEPAEFVQCSYNANFRGNYPGVGFTYDSGLDAFIPPKPFPSWVLNEETFRWDAPVPVPGKGSWDWDEQAGAWVEA
jgi:hypothetical protein